MSAVKAPRALETECETTIIQAAIGAGWRVHCSRSAQMPSGKWATPIKGHKGFVDLVLVRGREALFCELKRRPNKVEPEQAAWHEALRRARIACFTVWVPEELDVFVAYLVSREGALRPALEVHQ